MKILHVFEIFAYLYVLVLLGKCALKFVRHLHTAHGKTHDGIES